MKSFSRFAQALDLKYKNQWNNTSKGVAGEKPQNFLKMRTS